MFHFNLATRINNQMTFAYFVLFEANSIFKFI